MSNIPDSDKIKIEIDRRKLEKLVDDEVISAEDIANAPIYIVCPHCKSEDLADGDNCPSCGVSYE